MSDRLAAIEAKRARLVLRAAGEREHVSATLRQWSRETGWLDRGVAASRAALIFVKSHPILLATAMMALGVLRPRSAFKWARRGFALWRGYRWLIKKVAV